MTILDTILAHKRLEIAARKLLRPLSGLNLQRTSAGEARDFRGALLDSQCAAPRLIAEVKRRSPSKGPLRPDLNAAQVAAIYEQNGAAAVSVLTDERFFGGALADLTAARNAVAIPLLCKEFIVDPYQIYEAFSAGADAILLIATALETEQLSEYRHLAQSLGMDALVEVHDHAELEAALESGAELIGINNRDLRTFEVSLETTRALLPLIPPQIVTVSESGILSLADREAMTASPGFRGVDALLVGERLITAHDIAAATRELSGLGLVAAQSASREGLR